MLFCFVFLMGLEEESLSKRNTSELLFAVWLLTFSTFQNKHNTLNNPGFYFTL